MKEELPLFLSSSGLTHGCPVKLLGLWIESLISTFIVIAGLDPAIQGHEEPLWSPLDPRVKPEDDNKME
ncbi:hypothetical protein [Inquilinus limosus]|nr:hypothetical protein [Inquilinus limosus]